MKTKSIVRPAALFVAGICVATAFAARSEIAAMINPSTQATPGCDGLQKAMSAALNNNVRLVAETSIDPGKYFDAGSPDSCLGNLSTANIDLSKLISDPMGMLTGGVDSMIDGLKKAALGAACTAARNSVGDTISKFNAVMSTINGDLNTQARIDTTIGDTSRQILDAAATTWQTPAAADVLSGVPLPAPAPLPVVQQVQQVAPQMQPAAQPQPLPPPAFKSLGAAIFSR